MKIGTKSVLFGAHCFFIHPWFVALGWWKLYGFPWDPRLWAVFFLHDLGYWGKPNMDGEEGEKHVEWGANVVHKLFDWPRVVRIPNAISGTHRENNYKWLHLSLLHSRFYAKQVGLPPSKLCAADKLAIALEPWWLYLPRVNLTGEVKEYMKLADARTQAGEKKYATMRLNVSSQRKWFDSMCIYLREWANEHKGGGKEDTWTPDMKKARDTHGVWQ